jgi:Growth inhibitor
MNKREIKQGDIYMVNLDGIENEEKGIRPCICLSCYTLTKNRKNVIVAPITSSETKKDMINHYILLKENYPFFVYPKNTVLLECIRDVSKIRLENIWVK